MLRHAPMGPLACAAVTALVACRPHSSVPALSGTVGQLEDGDEFVTFIHMHEGRAVALDVRFPEEDFQGSADSDPSTFDVWEDCEDLAEGQKPSALNGGCTGFEYSVPNPRGTARPLVKEGGVWRLRGRFRVELAGGPLQGLMVVRLVPVSSGSHE